MSLISDPLVLLFIFFNLEGIDPGVPKELFRKKICSEGLARLIFDLICVSVQSWADLVNIRSLRFKYFLFNTRHYQILHAHKQFVNERCFIINSFGLIFTYVLYTVHIKLSNTFKT